MKGYDIPCSNYPPGVSDDDPYFNSDNEGNKPRLYRSEPKPLDAGPDHDPECECEECVCPF